MDLYYGPPDSAQLEQIHRLNRDSFAPDRTVDSVRDGDTLDGMGHRRVLARGAEVLASCHVLDFSVLVRGHRIMSTGLSAVATPPGHRRRGYVRQLLARSTSESAGRGHGLSLLWAFSEAFYDRMGWATGGDSLRFTFPPSVLHQFSTVPAGRYAFLEPDDYHLIEPVYRQWSAQRPLVLERTPEWWKRAVFRNWETRFTVVAWEKDGVTRAYMRYTISDTPDGPRMVIRSLRSVDLEGFRAMWHLAYSYQGQVSSIQYRGTSDDPLQWAVTEWGPGAKVELVRGHMVRVVCPHSLLHGFPIQDGVCGVLDLEVSDPMPGAVPVSLGLEMGPGRVRVRDAGRGPRLTLDTGTLARVVTGYVGVKGLVALGLLDGPGDAVDLLDRAFPPTVPLFREAF